MVEVEVTVGLATVDVLVTVAIRVVEVLLEKVWEMVCVGLGPRMQLHAESFTLPAVIPPLFFASLCLLTNGVSRVKVVLQQRKKDVLEYMFRLCLHGLCRRRRG